MIDDLVNKYQKDRNHYISDIYNEAQLRADFLDPLFELLGWDIQNKQAKLTSEREVVVETPLKDGAGSTTKKPDYAFRLFSDRKFFLEAKKPHVNIVTDPEPAIQTRRYGFTAKMKISVLSNFEYLAIYDCSQVVETSDSPSESRVKIYHYTEYVEKFEEINHLLGKESVYMGSFDETWSTIEDKLQQFSVDDLFLSQINKWRLILGTEILKHNNMISQVELNDLVQRYLNSIIFLRVCEDRNLEEYKTLLNLASGADFSKLILKFEDADKKYNSGLFKHKMNNEIIKNNASSFWTIIGELYFPHSAYSFSVISSDILGRIYEVFLGQELVISDSLNLTLDKKPEHIDRDIVTTPTSVIKDIISISLLKQLESKPASYVLNLKVADISCGSGAFLLEAYQSINDYLIDWYLANDPSILIQINIANYKLPFAIKREILEKCIYGIDKDYGAVEACKFGLLLKLLEDEDSNSITIPALPSLDLNIQYGNSLIDPEDIKADDRAEINPLKLTDSKFDVIIGNPPYMSTEDMKTFTPKELPLYKKKYVSSYKQFDKYFLFIERGFDLLSEDGRLSYIIPSKFMKVGAGQKLRELLHTHGALEDVVSFGANQVFEDKSTYTCMVVLNKKPRVNFTYKEIAHLTEWNTLTPEQKGSDSSLISLDELSDDVWIMTPAHLKASRHAVLKNTMTLEEMVGIEGIYNGIQTSANNIYIHTSTDQDVNFIYFQYGGKNWKVEKQLTRPYFKTASNEGALSSYRMLQPNSFVIYPYLKEDDKLSFVNITALKNKFPFMYSFLNSYKDILSNPKRDIKPTPDTSDEWYRYGRHQSLEKCDVDQKIVVGVLSQGDKYAIDVSHTLISSGGTAGYCMVTPPKNSSYSVYYLQAILNSKYTEWYASLIGEIFRGGFIARGTKVLKKLPIKIINFNDPDEKAVHDAISKLQQDLIYFQSEIDKYKSNPRALILAQREFSHIKKSLQDELKKLYNLSENDDLIPIIKKTYASN